MVRLRLGFLRHLSNRRLRIRGRWQILSLPRFRDRVLDLSNMPRLMAVLMTACLCSSVSWTPATPPRPSKNVGT
ncbi:hypothetical protein IQ63_24170 [Streptomyces acidiscabies]|uniref:Uncharacterized protein n=1 Tax=Streptomyces acidiscabies TaxID=42234 RepID=A0A0L0K2U0_9ACTN|nr:hypothetical protein IQ63_24170 [Streptomyces acidiscabies]